MFDLAEERLAWIPVTWPGLKQSSPDAVAEPCEHRIEMLAVILSADKFRAVFADTGEGIPDDETPEQMTERINANNLTKVKSLIRGWRNIVMKGQPAEFTDDNIVKLCNLPNFSSGFDTSYMQAWMGRIELAEKNSADSSASGQPDAGEGNTKKPTSSRRRRRR